MQEQRLINLRIAHTSHQGVVEGKEVDVTDPIRLRPQGMSRRQWRELVRKGYRVSRKQELQRRREEAAMPESAKLDRRLHEAGLYSHRDVGRVVPVERQPVILIGG